MYRFWGDSLGLWADEEEREIAVNLLIRASEVYAIAESLDKSDSTMYNNWGNTFLKRVLIKSGEEYPSLLNQAIQKYEIAMGLKPDNSLAMTNIGMSYLNLLDFVSRQEQPEIIAKARRYLLCAERIEKGCGAFNLAILYALMGNDFRSKKWLKVAKKERKIPIDLLQEIDQIDDVGDEKWIDKFLGYFKPNK